jgi:hypothetical protein
MTQREAIAHIVGYLDYAETIGEKTKHLQACAVLQEAVSKLEFHRKLINTSIGAVSDIFAVGIVKKSIDAFIEKSKYNDQDQADT